MTFYLEMKNAGQISNIVPQDDVIKTDTNYKFLTRKKDVENKLC